jgi:hypothetical protein
LKGKKGLRSVLLIRVWLCQNEAPFVMTTRGANMMGQTVAAAIRALGGCNNAHGIMGAAHASARGGGFSLRNSHGGILKNSKNKSKGNPSYTIFLITTRGWWHNVHKDNGIDLTFF